MIKVFKDVKKFTIDRKKWYRGKGPDQSCLLTANNKQCCLGFYGEACGIPKMHLVNVNSPPDSPHVFISKHLIASPENISKTYKGYFWDSFLISKNDDGDNYNSDTCEELMTINDSEDISDSDREEKLKKIFKKHGIKVTFVN